jgi:putative transposase
MNNHVHMLSRIPQYGCLASAMHGLQLAYAKYYNDRTGSCGRVWQGRFHSNIVEDDKYLLTAGLYSEANPVRAGIVAKPEEYLWSSYRSYVENLKDPLIDFNPYYINLGKDTQERSSAYKQIMSDYLKMYGKHL